MSNTKLIQYTHRPNTTELGMGNTHETYMLINSETDLSDFFPPTIEVKVRDSLSGKFYFLKSTSGREFRVNQMGELYRNYNVHPGDEIVFTKIEKGLSSDICVSVRQYSRIVLLVGSNGAEIVNIDRLTDYIVDERKYSINVYDRGNQNTIEISYRESRKKRNDSPNTTDYYNVSINHINLANGTYYLTIGSSSSLAMLPKSEYNTVEFDEGLLNTFPINDMKNNINNATSFYRPYITAIKSKPFLLLAGISGTGKSRIVRELARACWDVGSEEYKAPKPRNFEMVQVKPNWHDSSELIGYVSRVSGEPVFVAGEFLKFVAKAWEDSDVPYFLCLDEMNLAPVEQYFAEYLSVIESRKVGEDGKITADPIIKINIVDKWYHPLVASLTNDEDTRRRFLEDGICIPQNLIVVGTVNMDETTFSFSRKVLDRAMTIEMNEVDLYGGLESRYEHIGKLGAAELIGNAVEGVDVYASNKSVCDTAIDYLQKINEKLEGTPFKVAYRTRNEVLLYVVNNLPYSKNEDGEDLAQEYVIARALDEITNMKILSRIEGDESKVSEKFLNELSDTIKKGLEDVFEGLFDEDDDDVYKSVSLAKIEEMKGRLESGYTSFWS